MKSIDPQKLLAHLNSKVDHPDLLYHTAYAGLITAVERGDFDYEKDKEVPHDLVQGRRQPRVPPEGPRGG